METTVTVQDDIVTKKFVAGCEISSRYFNDELRYATAFIPDAIVECDCENHKIVFVNMGVTVDKVEDLDIEWFYKETRAQIEQFARGGFIHGDIKPHNILYKDKKITIIDYEHMMSTTASYTIGTSGFQSPELLLHGRLTNRVDLWALGATVLTLMLGYEVFYSLPEGTMEKIFKCRGVNLDPAIFAFLEVCESESEDEMVGDEDSDPETSSSSATASQFEMHRELLISALLLGIERIPRELRTSYWFDSDGNFLYYPRELSQAMNRENIYLLLPPERHEFFRSIETELFG